MNINRTTKGFTDSGFLGYKNSKTHFYPGMTLNSRKQGFTLIELLVVIAIIGLLSSVVLASLSTARAKARDARRVEDIRNIKLALELYYDTNNSYPVAPPANTSNGWVTSNSTLNWSWLYNEIKSYTQAYPKDPTNVWPYVYYYRTASSTMGPTPCFVKYATEGEMYVMLLATENTTYNFNKWSTGEGGSKERYCVIP